MWQRIGPDALWKWLDLAPGLRLFVWRDEGWWWRLEGRGEAGEDEVTILRSDKPESEVVATLRGMKAAARLGRMVVSNVSKAGGEG